MYQETTQAIRVTVESRFMASKSSPDRGLYFWAYSIEITNTGPEAVQLLSRHWMITDGEGQTEVVEGEGVVGEQPMINPGETYAYTSGCRLPTPSGIMVGRYQMESQRGEGFAVAIPAFSLDMPEQNRTLN